MTDYTIGMKGIEGFLREMDAGLTNIQGYRKCLLLFWKEIQKGKSGIYIQVSL
jgi:hypothetical protein